MPPGRGFGPEMCEKPPMQYTSPDGGLDPVALEPTDGPIHTQWIHSPIWSGLTHGTGVAVTCCRCMYVFFSGLNALAKCQDAMPSKHTSTLTTTTFRPWKQNSTTLRVSDHTINAFPFLYSTNKTVTL